MSIVNLVNMILNFFPEYQSRHPDHCGSAAPDTLFHRCNLPEEGGWRSNGNRKCQYCSFIAPLHCFGDKFRIDIFAAFLRGMRHDSSTLFHCCEGTLSHPSVPPEVSGFPCAKGGGSLIGETEGLIRARREGGAGQNRSISEMHFIFFFWVYLNKDALKCLCGHTCEKPTEGSFRFSVGFAYWG